jgi:AcrR family transcriptional regulator
MRLKDEFKQKAIFKATVKLVNELGFVSSSVAKIAKEADVSPATIYVYYKNKDDLLASTYRAIKQDISAAILNDFDETLPIRDIFRNTWFNLFDYISTNREDFQFTEQFANSPYSDQVNRAEIEGYFEPLIRVLMRGIQQKIIKNVHQDIIGTFLFYPVMILTNSRLCQTFEPTHDNMDTAFGLAWDAIKF